MAEEHPQTIRLELEIPSDESRVLDGLNHWLALGLISEPAVRALCQEKFVCALPPLPAPVQATSTLPDFLDPPAEGADDSPAPVADFLPFLAEPPPARRPARPDSAPAPAARGLVSLWLNRFMSELSVVWLLGLGVFLIVLSSAVLAATQWASFSVAGQYLILLAYTLAFWGIGLWSSGNERLQLTAHTLQLITLLLVPLNVWAMDGLGIWATGAGVLVAVIAAITLTLAVVQVMRTQQAPALVQASALGLSALHVGWAVPIVPVLAVYGGTWGSAIALFLAPTAALNAPPRSRRWPLLAVGFALGLLLLRGLTVIPQHDWGQLGLGFGAYGAAWLWLGQQRLAQAGDAAAAETTVPVAETDTLAAEAAPEPGPAPMRPDPPRASIGLGRALLWWGWLIALEGPLGQAFGVSVLGLGLRVQALQQRGRQQDLLVGYGIAVQLAFVGWQLVPSALRTAIMTPLTAWAGTSGMGDGSLLGLSLFPYVVAMVALADGYLRRGRTQLGEFSDGIALGSNLVLTLCSLASYPVLVVNLMATTVTTLIVTWRRRPTPGWRIGLSTGLILLTTLVTIDYLWPTLPPPRWIIVLTALATLWLGGSRWLPRAWGKITSLYGYGLAGVADVLLWGHLLNTSFRSSLGWIGLVIPLTLALTGRHRASIVTTGLALPLTLGVPWTRLVGLGTATGLTLANSKPYGRPWVATLTVGMGLGFVVSVGVDLVPQYPRNAADWCGVAVGLMAGVWLLWGWLSSLDGEAAGARLTALYKNATDLWGHGLAVGLLVYLSLALVSLYSGLAAPEPLYLVAQIGLLLLLGWRYRGQVQPITLYLAGWGSELLVAQLLGWQQPTAVYLAVATLGLGAVALMLGVVLDRRQPDLIFPLHVLTLAYAVLALALRSTTATAWTGWLVIGAALLLLEVGRRNQRTGMRWLALVGLSCGWYEQVIYHMLQAEGGEPMDGIIVLAGVAALIMLVYRLAANRLDRHLHLPQAELVWTAHIHWFIGSVLMLAVGITLLTRPLSLTGVGLVVVTALSGYALLQGRIALPHNPPSDSPSNVQPDPQRDPQRDLQSAWVYAGLSELVGWFVLLRFTVPALAVLDAWWGAVACALAVPIYWMRWSAWGWPQRPWQVMAVAVPLAITLFTHGFDHIPTLWILAGFYGWLAWHSRRVRISYISAACIAWAVWVWLGQQGIQDTLAYVLPLGSAVLYAAQVDPHLRQSAARHERHWLRLLAMGAILFTALLTDRWTGLAVGAMALGVIAAGLVWRIRAFLYMGTVVFGLNALNQLIVLNATYPFMKWIVGIVVGVALIWIAADFERRRAQWLVLTQNWVQDLDQWQ